MSSEELAAVEVDQLELGGGFYFGSKPDRPNKLPGILLHGGPPEPLFEE